MSEIAEKLREQEALENMSPLQRAIYFNTMARRAIETELRKIRQTMEEKRG